VKRGRARGWRIREELGGGDDREELDGGAVEEDLGGKAVEEVLGDCDNGEELDSGTVGV
jgi:hypothetical protein